MINEVHYSFTEKTDGYGLAGRITVSGPIREKWRTSELLPPGFDRAVDSRREERNLSLYRPGFLAGEFRFSDFTNISELKFPMLAEFRRYDPQMIGAGAQPKEGHGGLLGTMTLVIHRVERVNGTIGILPVSNQSVFVQDKRLFSHRYHIEQVRFQTNCVASFEISPQARIYFEGALKKAQVRERLHRRQQIFTVLLILALGLGGLGMHHASRAWLRGTQRPSQSHK